MIRKILLPVLAGIALLVTGVTGIAQVPTGTKNSAALLSAAAPTAAASLSSAAAGTGPAAANRNNQTAAPALEHRNPRYRIELGDVIGLTFPFTPEHDENVTVQPDGYISLITIGDMHVEGMTSPELTAALRKAYSTVLHDPVITVSLSNFENPYFIVGGEVGKPGKYDLHGDTTVTQAIEIAGGFTYTSKHSHVLLFRRVSDDWVSARVIDVKKMLKAGNLAEDLHLEPGDMVFVPKNTLSKVQPFLPYLLPYQLFRINFTSGATTYLP